MLKYDRGKPKDIIQKQKKKHLLCGTSCASSAKLRLKKRCPPVIRGAGKGGVIFELVCVCRECRSGKKNAAGVEMGHSEHT